MNENILMWLDEIHIKKDSTEKISFEDLVRENMKFQQEPIISFMLVK